MLPSAALIPPCAATVAAGREHLAGGRETRLRQLEGRTEPRATSADHHIGTVIDEGGAAHAGTPTASCRTAMAPATAASTNPNFIAISSATRRPSSPRSPRHDLQPEDRVPCQRADHDQQQRRRQRCAEPRPHAVQVDTAESRQGDEEPDAENRQRDSAQPLCVPVPGPPSRSRAPAPARAGPSGSCHLRSGHAARATAPRRARAKRWRTAQPLKRATRALETDPDVPAQVPHAVQEVVAPA